MASSSGPAPPEPPAPPSAAANRLAAKKRPRRVQAKRPFVAPSAEHRTKPPRLDKPPRPDPTEEIRVRAPLHVVRRGPVPRQLQDAAEAAGFIDPPVLPDAFRHTVTKHGTAKADKVMRSTTERLRAKGVRFGTGTYDPEVEVVEEKVELIQRKYTDQVLRQAFNVLDLNGDDNISISELRHCFAQIGEMPTENELKAMVVLCDPKGEGHVSFDDFLGVFANPQEALRHADKHAIKHLLPRKKVNFDVRDPLGLKLEEMTKLKRLYVVVTEVRKNSQAADEGVLPGWKVTLIDGKPVTTLKMFEATVAKVEKDLEEAEAYREATKEARQQAEAEAVARAESGLQPADTGKGSGKGKDGKDASGKPVPGPPKYDYEITFSIERGESSSSSSEEEDDTQKPLETEDEDEDEDEN